MLFYATSFFEKVTTKYFVSLYYPYCILSYVYIRHHSTFCC